MFKSESSKLMILVFILLAVIIDLCVYKVKHKPDDSITTVSQLTLEQIEEQKREEYKNTVIDVGSIKREWDSIGDGAGESSNNVSEDSVEPGLRDYRHETFHTITIKTGDTLYLMPGTYKFYIEPDEGISTIHFYDINTNNEVKTEALLIDKASNIDNGSIELEVNDDVYICSDLVHVEMLSVNE